MRCFSFCSGLYAIYDVITVPSEGIFSFEGATLSSFPQFILYVVSFLDCKSEWIEVNCSRPPDFQKKKKTLQYHNVYVRSLI